MGATVDHINRAGKSPDSHRNNVVELYFHVLHLRHIYKTVCLHISNAIFSKNLRHIGVSSHSKVHRGKKC